MKSQRNWKILLVVLCLLITILACGKGFTTTRTSTGDKGKVVLKLASLDGSDETQIEIDNNFTWDTLALEITVEVEAGSFQAEFIDDEGQSLIMNASAGQPATGKRNMVTDGLGKITLNSQGEGAQNATITIEYSKIQ